MSELNRQHRKSKVTPPTMSVSRRALPEELSFKNKPFWCKLGRHEYDSVYNGASYHLGCTKCFKIHPFFEFLRQ